MKSNNGILTEKEIQKRTKFWNKKQFRTWTNKELERTSTDMQNLLVAIKGFSMDEIKAIRKFDLTAYVPECFGSCDCDIVGETVLNIIDLKYGKGVQVDADGNSQLMMYAIGVLNSLEPLHRSKIETVRMHIAQVRLGNYCAIVTGKPRILS